MSKFKGGIVGLGIIFMIFIFGLFLILIYVGVDTFNVGLKSKVNLQISMEKDDMGTGLTSLLKSKTHDLTYMEVIADSSARNYKEFIGNDISSLEKTLRSMSDLEKKNYTIVFYYKGTNIFGPTQKSDNVPSIDIPVPGGNRGSLEVIS